MTTVRHYDIFVVSDDSRKGDMKKERPNRRLFNDVMETRVTTRLDKQHLKKIEHVMKQNKFNSMSEAIRFIIQNYQIK